MKIEIDTKHDSPEHIKSAIQMLQQVLEQQSPSVVSPILNTMQQTTMQAQQVQQPIQQESTPVSGGIFDIFGDSSQQQEKKADDSVKIIQY